VQADLPDEAAGLVRVDRRRYGESALSFYRPSRAGRVRWLPMPLLPCPAFAGRITYNA
jgi:hypothetical protein